MTAGSRISVDVRLIIIRMHSVGFCTRDIAFLTALGERSIRRIVHEYDVHGTFGQQERKKRGARMTADMVEDLVDYVNQFPDCQLADYRRFLVRTHGLEFDLSTIWRYLRLAGYSQKMITKAARERDPIKRAEYILRVLPYKAHELVFIDESSFDRRTSNRVRGWAKKGERLVRSVFFFRGERYSILPALSLNRGIFYADVVQGSYNSDLFYSFIKVLLMQMNPYDLVTHPECSVIVLDNCAIHRNPEALDLILESGMRYVFLPPYSPDYNPIELAFSSMKFWFRRNNEEVARAWNTEDEARLLLMRMAYSVTPDKARGWIRKCNYPVE